MEASIKYSFLAHCDKFWFNYVGPAQSHIGKSQSQFSQRTGSPHDQRTPSPIGTISQGSDKQQRTCSPVDRQSLSGSPIRRSSSGSLSPRSPTSASPMTVEDDGMFLLKQIMHEKG